MSKSISASKAQSVDDIWTKLENSPPPQSLSEENVDTTTIFVGDAGSGKSTLIQGFLKPNVSKEPKPTFALEYNFARKKGSQASSKSIAHIWEMGGDIWEPKLLEMALTARTLATTVVVICCDLSKPQNALACLQRWIKLSRELIKRRISELQSSDPDAVAALRNAAASQYQEHPNDAPRARPCEIPLYIVGTKYDIFKTMNSGDRRSVTQLIRFVAHYHGTSFIATSSAETSLKESFRNVLSGICFRATPKVQCETSIDKPMFITAGKDDFEAILLSSVSKDGSSDSSSGSTKSKLLYSETDVSNFVSPQGLTRDCWSRFAEHLNSVFGSADPSPEQLHNESISDESNKAEDNEFPEAEIDEMRAQRDVALQRYIQVGTLQQQHDAHSFQFSPTLCELQMILKVYL